MADAVMKLSAVCASVCVFGVVGDACDWSESDVSAVYLRRFAGR